MLETDSQTPLRRVQPRRRTGLAVAHPGHELRLSGWIARERPAVFVLTSGSRAGEDRMRVEASRALARRLGARPGGLFGDHLDRDVYAWIMAGDAEPFLALARRLADEIVAERLDRVVTDSWQLYNVVHDLWHLVVRTAATWAAERLGRPVACLDYPVVPAALAQRTAGPMEEARRLGAPEVRRKLALAAAFPAIADDLAEVLQAGGRDFVASESLHRLRPVAELLPRAGEQPAYEWFGERRVAAGLYGEVLRWGHAAPVVAALAEAARAWDAAA